MQATMVTNPPIQKTQISAVTVDDSCWSPRARVPCIRRHWGQFPTRGTEPRDQPCKTRDAFCSAMDAAAKIAALRRDLRALQRLRRCRRRAVDARGTLSRRLQMRAVLLLLLCKNTQLVLQWIQREQRRRGRVFSGLAVDITEEILHTWHDTWGDDTDVLLAANSADHPWRIELQAWYMEALVAAKIRDANARGIKAPPPMVITWYVAAHRERLPDEGTEARLTALETERGVQRRWLQQFRRHWPFQWGGLTDVRPMSHDEMQRKTLIFVRWAYWLAAQYAEQDAIVINMDETSVANIKDLKHGLVIHRHYQQHLDNPAAAREKGRHRTTLMAVLASNSEIQEHLPQVVLTRTRRNHGPSRRIQKAHMEAKYPQEAWHGVAGWNNTELMILWLGRLRRKLDILGVQEPVILAMDCHSAHVAAKVLQHAQSLGFAVILVPARMTWLLQPLDATVFAPLKRRIRMENTRARASTIQGTLLPHVAVSCAATAIDAVLVHSSHKKDVARVGLLGPGETLARSVRHVCGEGDLTPRPPSQEDLCICLGKHPRKVLDLWTPLTTLPSRPEVPRAGPASGSSRETLTGPSPLHGQTRTGPEPSLLVAALNRGRSKHSREPVPLAFRLPGTRRNYWVTRVDSPAAAAAEPGRKRAAAPVELRLYPPRRPATRAKRPPAVPGPAAAAEDTTQSSTHTPPPATAGPAPAVSATGSAPSQASAEPAARDHTTMFVSIPAILSPDTAPQAAAPSGSAGSQP